MSTLAVANISGLTLSTPVSFYATPLAPTATVGDSSNKLATTSFVMSAIGAVSTGAYFTLGATTILSGTSVSSVAGVSLESSPIGQTTPANGTFVTLVSVTSQTTGQALIAAGSAGAPALAFTGDTDTGLFHTGSGSFAVTCNGNETLRFNPSAPPTLSVALSPTDNSTSLATTAFVQNLLGTSTPAITGTHRNLSLAATGVDANTYVSVEEILLESAAGSYYTVRNFAGILNSSTTGLNGLDSGTVAATSWYAVWIISNGTVNGVLANLPGTFTCTASYNSNTLSSVSSIAGLRVGQPISGSGIAPGTFIASVVSGTVTMSQPCIGSGLSTTSITVYFVADPIMPSGYVYKSRVGWMRTNTSGASSRPIPFRQRNGVVSYMTVSGSITQQLISSNSLANVATDLKPFVPPTASTAYLQLVSTGASNQCSVSPNSNASATPLLLSGLAAAGVEGTTELRLEGYGNVYVTANGGTAGIVNVLGWSDSL